MDPASLALPLGGRVAAGEAGTRFLAADAVETVAIGVAVLLPTLLPLLAHLPSPKVNKEENKRNGMNGRGVSASAPPDWLQGAIGPICK